MRSVRGHSEQADPGVVQTSLKVYGMKDAISAQAAYDALAALDGVQHIYLDIGLRRATISHDPRAGIAAEMIKRLGELGLRAIEKG